MRTDPVDRCLPFGLHSVVLSVTSRCNISCSYCQNHPFMQQCRDQFMPEKVLFEVFSQLAAFDHGDDIFFTYSGGEPLLAGKSYFNKIIKMQREHFGSKTKVINIIQTNGTLLDDSWISLLKDNEIFVSISVDGPEDIHNSQRPYKDGEQTFADVMRAISILKSNGIHYGVLGVITEASAKHSQEIVEFLLSLEPEIIAFLPCVQYGPVLQPDTFGEFNISAFDAWIDPLINPRAIPIRTFRDIWLRMSGFPVEGECMLTGLCPSHPNINTDGSVWVCDQLLGEPQAQLGNVNHESLDQIFRNETTLRFLKYSIDIPLECKQCEFISLCGGGCLFSRLNNNGMEYYCNARKRLFRHIINRVQGMLGNEWSPALEKNHRKTIVSQGGE